MQLPQRVGQQDVWGNGVCHQARHILAGMRCLVSCHDPGEQGMRSCCICLDGLSHHGVDDLVRVGHKALQRYGDQFVAHGCASPMSAKVTIAQIIMLTSELRSIDHHVIPNAPSASSRLTNFMYPKGQEPTLPSGECRSD